MQYDVDYTPYYYPKDRGEHKKSRRNKPKKARTRAQKIGVLIILVCLSITLLALDHLTGAINPVSSITDTGVTYYCVQTGVYTDQDTANYYAGLDKTRASGGYVLYDGTFHVIASIYPLESQATTVAKRLTDGGSSASVYIITVPPFPTSNLDEEEIQVLNTVSNFSDQCYRELYELSNLIDQENITAGELSTRLYSLKQFVTKQQSLVTNVYTSDMLKLSACIGATVEIIDTLGANPTSSQLRYAYTAILAQRL